MFHTQLPNNIDDNIETQSCQSGASNNTVQQILNIEIPKIKVIVRKRPLNQKELSNKETDNIAIQDNNKVVLSELKENLDLSKYIDFKEFIFDRAYDQQTTNQDIYIENIRPMIFNSFYLQTKISCFAFGQTGSGKTYTMIGGQNNNVGQYLLAGYDIFNILQNESKFHNFKVLASFYEIYCDKLFDLLNNKNKLEIREDKNHDINIVGLSETQITNLDDLMKIINAGGKQRAVGKTGANADSSRSHGVIQLRIINQNNMEHSKITFIDLAGSERESDKVNVDKKTRIDGAEINKSLLALKECIRALELDKTHLPFRGSRLTLVLRDSFIGNCKLLMITNISPGYASAEHTLNSLRYAYRVKELKKPKSSNNVKNKNNKSNNLNNNNLTRGIKTETLIANMLGGNNKIKNGKNNPSFDSNNTSSDDNKIIRVKMGKKNERRNSSSISIKNNSIGKNKKNVTKTNNNINIFNNLKSISNVFNTNNTNNNINNNNLNTNNISESKTDSFNANENNNLFSQKIKMNMNTNINNNINNQMQISNLQNINPNSNSFMNNNSFINNNSFDNKSLSSFKSSKFANLNLVDLENKNSQMLQYINNQEKLVKEISQKRINLFCELVKTEMTTFQQFQQEQLDTITYIESIQNINNCHLRQINDFNIQLEKLKYMINQQTKVAQLINSIKEELNNSRSYHNLSGLLDDTTIFKNEDQNARNLRNLQEIQSQVGGSINLNNSNLGSFNLMG